MTFPHPLNSVENKPVRVLMHPRVVADQAPELLAIRLGEHEHRKIHPGLENQAGGVLLAIICLARLKAVP